MDRATRITEIRQAADELDGLPNINDVTVVFPSDTTNRVDSKIREAIDRVLREEKARLEAILLGLDLDAMTNEARERFIQGE